MILITLITLKDLQFKVINKSFEQFKIATKYWSNKIL